MASSWQIPLGPSLQDWALVNMAEILIWDRIDIFEISYIFDIFNISDIFEILDICEISEISYVKKGSSFVPLG